MRMTEEDRNIASELTALLSVCPVKIAMLHAGYDKDDIKDYCEYDCPYHEEYEKLQEILEEWLLTILAGWLE